MERITLVGRSSSHFTRTARVFALELGLAHDFRVVPDLARLEAANYAGNPALKIPILIDEQGSLYGTENICAELVRRSGRRSQVVLRGDVAARMVANAEELVLAAMAAEVSLITAKAAGSTSSPKPLQSIRNCLDYVQLHLDDVLAALPSTRAFSFLEVTLFCLVRHLPFRDVMSVETWPRLAAFADDFGRRESARASEYRFDAS